MDPTSIYPLSIKLYQNEESIGYPNVERLSKNDIQEFFYDYVVANSSEYEYMGSLPIE